MKNKILELVANYPKHYPIKIQKNSELLEWVKANTKVMSTTLAEMIYSAVYQQTNICKKGNTKKFISINLGYSFCGHSSTCSCNNEHSSNLVSLAKTSYTDEKKKQIEETRKATMNAMYGCEYNSLRKEVKCILQHHKIVQDVYIKLNDKDWVYTEYIANNRTLVDIAKELNVHYGTVGEYCKKHNFKIRKRSLYSLVELEIILFIESLHVDVEHSNWTILKDREIDIFIPSKNIGIEIDGLYWHSHCGIITEKNKNKHLSKSLDTFNRGVDLIHITDYEWKTQNDKIKSIISKRLKCAKTIIDGNACSVKTVSTTNEHDFLTQHHLNGYILSDCSYGLYCDNKLVSLLSLKITSDNCEILRFCSLLDTVVTNDFAILLNSITFDTIIVKCDIYKFSGKTYSENGFTKVKTLEPTYFLTNGTIPITSIVEDETKYRKFWNCGYYIYIKQKTVKQKIPI